jgi:hypothetical protein
MPGEAVRLERSNRRVGLPLGKNMGTAMIHGPRDTRTVGVPPLSKRYTALTLAKHHLPCDEYIG